MTKLELMICEAENNGEIDLDTRDMMLSILNESTAQARRSSELSKKVGAIWDKIDELENQQWKYKKLGNESMAKSLEYQIEKLEKEADRLCEKRAGVDPGLKARNARYYGRNKKIEKGKENASENKWRGNNVKESVMEEIYEAELCGDITPEERMALLDYMD